MKRNHHPQLRRQRQPGNPGLAGIGIVLAAEDATPLVTIGKYIGKATNNVAEYMALIVGLREAAKLGRLAELPGSRRR